MKTIFDKLFSLVAISLLSPIFVSIFLVLLYPTEFSPFFVQERIGYKGRKFKMYKFRTMRKNAEKELENILKKNPLLQKEWSENFKLKDDPRIIPFGKFLRKTSLDELPQLFNVLKGDMSIVGPRPIVTEEVSKYGKSFEFYKLVKPGITGLWQVSGRSRLSYKERVRLDKKYISECSFKLDLIILFKTILNLLKGGDGF